MLDESGYSFSQESIITFVTMMSELKKWNKTNNLTAINSDEEVIVKHLIDSLSLVKYINLGERLLDVGSGGGFPSIPLKIARPDISIVSVDAVLKKITFQKHLVRMFSLQNFNAVHCRVETMYEKYIENFDVITSRAFSQLASFISIVSPLLKKEGRLLAMKGPGYDLECDNLALQKLGFIVTAIYPYTLPKNMGERYVIELKRHE